MMNLNVQIVGDTMLFIDLLLIILSSVMTGWLFGGMIIYKRKRK